MSAYEELVERCAYAARYTDDVIGEILAEVLRTLETVTPEMARAHGEAEPNSRAEWLAALRASPLVPSPPK